MRIACTIDHFILTIKPFSVHYVNKVIITLDAGGEMFCSTFARSFSLIMLLFFRVRVHCHIHVVTRFQQLIYICTNIILHTLQSKSSRHTIKLSVLCSISDRSSTSRSIQRILGKDSRVFFKNRQMCV